MQVPVEIVFQNCDPSEGAALRSFEAGESAEDVQPADNKLPRGGPWFSFSENAATTVNSSAILRQFLRRALQKGVAVQRELTAYWKGRANRTKQSAAGVVRDDLFTIDGAKALVFCIGLDGPTVSFLAVLAAG